MALNLNELANNMNTVEKFYTISIDGVNFCKLNETDTTKVIGYMKSLMNGSQVNFAPAPAEKHEVIQGKTDGKKLDTAKTTGISDVACKWQIAVVKVNNKNFYWIKDGIYRGPWKPSKYPNPKTGAAQEYRYPINNEAHYLANKAVKALDGVQTVHPDGAEYIAYGYTNKKTAEEMLKKLPEKICKQAIADCPKLQVNSQHRDVKEEQ